MPTNMQSDKMNQRALRVPFIVVCAGWAGLLVTVVSAARTDLTEFGSGLVLQWIVGFGTMASGLLLVSAAIGAHRLVSQHALVGERRNICFFRVMGVIGVVATLYGTAIYFGL
jgi:hypothetical protein